MVVFIVVAFLLWRIGLFITAYLASIHFVFSPTFPYADALLIPSGLPQWLWSFANFDGVHYLTIAQSGYSAQFTQVFFPLFSVLIKFTAFFVAKNYILAGLIIANVAFLLLLYLFARLLQIDGSGTRERYWIILFLVTFPFSFFFGSLYTESIFLLLTFASFLYARKKKWLYAGFFAALASATRVIGIFLLPALLWEYYQSVGRHKIIHIKKTQSISEKCFLIFRNIKIICNQPFIYVSSFGLLSYMAYLQWKFHDFLYFWHVQPVFGAQRSGSNFITPIQVMWRYMKILTGVSIRSYNFWVATWEFASFIVAIVALFIAYRKNIRFSYIIFSLFAILTPSFTGTFSSMPRYILVAFPIYIALGTIQNKYIKSIILFYQVILLILFTGLFTLGHWVS